MQKSESIAKVSAAIVAAQSELDNVAKDATNPHFRSGYASLPAILDTIRPVLAKHRLAVVQFPIDDGNGHVGVETTLLHESGEFISNQYGARVQKDDPQGAGSAITYARRYALAAVLAIGQEDDDGQAASKPKREAPRRDPPREATTTPTPSGRAISEAQAKRLWALSYAKGEACGVDRDHVEQIVRGIVGADGTKAIDTAEYDKTLTRIADAIVAAGVF